MTIKLNTIEDVYKFIDVAIKSVSDVCVKQKYYTVNGKSILGLFSLDLTQPIQLFIESGDYSQFEQFEL